MQERASTHEEILMPAFKSEAPKKSIKKNEVYRALMEHVEALQQEVSKICAQNVVAATAPAEALQQWK